MTNRCQKNMEGHQLLFQRKNFIDFVSKSAARLKKKQVCDELFRSLGKTDKKKTKCIKKSEYYGKFTNGNLKEAKKN